MTPQISRNTFVTDFLGISDDANLYERKIADVLSSLRSIAKVEFQVSMFHSIFIKLAYQQLLYLPYSLCSCVQYISFQMFCS